MKILLQWLYPGLNIKRWMILFSVGLIVLVFGMVLIMNYQVFGQMEESILRLLFFLTGTYSYTFLVVAGVGMVIIGAICMLYAVRKLVQRFFYLLSPDEKNPSRQIASKMELSRGMKIVAIGGGHGLSMLLRGLKERTSNISAIVTVADDGGSSGRLREEMNIVAPGDLRNCLVALSDKETVLEQLFQYRFSGEGELAGHSLGNLFLAALMKEFSDVQGALETASTVLNIRGRVLPATTEKIRLLAQMSDGETVAGESEIAAYIASKGGSIKIHHMSTVPKDPMAVGDALESIRQADIITLGPGSLYTSVLPDLLVPEILDAIKSGTAPCMYICNIMTQPEETKGYTVSDHLKALIDHIGSGVIDYVLVNNAMPKSDVLQCYEKVGAAPVIIDREEIAKLNVLLIEEDLIGSDRKAVHDTHILSNEIIRIANLLRTNISPEILAEYLGRKR